ncbi:MAG: class I tRNA ligase family protein [Fibrobacter intestinalis]|uniref:leucine--tRNA ligase n=1 Tax=Hallerella porci TaxID=1945871 RepID=A0ABX5LI09_9BACT|nr:class I tRNA ligase family protein [Hallerella porci]PWK93088.1 tRNA synthetase class I (I, L, M and V) [Hallerella porci]
MSKSLKNVVNPDDVVQKYGADSLRLYEMFMGPLDAVKPWNTQGIEGMYRFLSRAFRAVIGEEDTVEYKDTPVPAELAKVMHQSIIKVTDAIEKLSFNTAISQLMIFNNELLKSADRYRESCEVFALLLQPFAPHLAEEMWQVLGHKESMAYAPWPKAEEFSVEVVFQVNGKVRAKAQVAKDMDKAALEKLALDNDRLKEFMAGKTVVKSIVVPGKLVSIVVK